MHEIVSIRPLLAVIASLAVTPILLSARSPNVREGWTFAAGAVKLGIVLSMLPAVLGGNVFCFALTEVIPGIRLAFRVDAMGMLFALVASTLWIVTSAYSIGYMRGLDEHSQTRYYCFFAIALSATIGAAFAANLVTLYMFYEILSFATYPLVTHHQDEEAKISGRKYLFFIVGGSVVLVLPAMIICHMKAGTLDFAPQGFLAGHVTQGLATVLLLLFVFGLAKAALMPMHSWLPAAMVAPTPVSALLHAVAVVKVGAFSVARVLTGVFGVDLLAQYGLGTLLAVLASITILVASFIALSQDGLKRRLAFSTIGQLSYILLGVALLTPKGITGGLVHIAMHAFGKITLFFCAGAIFVAAGIKNISEMKGLGRRMPITMGAFFIGSLSVIGLPPGGGFISKWFLALGALESHELAFLGVLLFSSFLNAAYFLPIAYNAFFAKPPDDAKDAGFQEAPPWCVAPLAFTAMASVWLFFNPWPFLDLARLAAAQVIGG
ncbi:monovalent cation/H+ antiporter subunit D family protein [Desulfatibacillum aliphaticivorans]|uniref:monovalent cation/H+ antiporter subunit D family protein n=1 Tax=Desulfatibacillum aliphaticivorans TaxID=218208 RepID=UPI000410DCBD|nr:monovalent cation/H+ antiporter subunit D family protein [Desulfatibacillum aliphaticivorans]